jgi:hypothetical protein
MNTTLSLNSERGQSLLGLAIFFTIFVIGIILVGNSVGVDVVGKALAAMSAL